MAWLHSDWITECDLKDRERKLRLHIKEVSDVVTTKVMSDGTLYDPTTNKDYLDSLYKRLDEVAGGGSRITRGRVVAK